MDVSRQSISKWENDKAYPEMTRLLFMSDYFGVTLDYLMRGSENESKENDTIKYKAKNMLMIWNNFVSNLSDKQRKFMMVFYVLLIFVMIAILAAFLYGAGWAIGQLIGNIQNDIIM